MIRFVVSPGRELVPDLSARLPGRGIWLSASADVIEPACAKGLLARAFARAAHGPVSVPHDFLSVLEMSLVQRIGERLGLARRAGQAIAGFEKAREWLRTGRVRLVMQASDGSETERARFLSGIRDTVPVLSPLSGAAMGRVFGRDYVVHVAIAPGKLADSLELESGRLAGLRTRPAAVNRRNAAGSKDDEAGANG
jgi:uncharacterized protein